MTKIEYIRELSRKIEKFQNYLMFWSDLEIDYNLNVFLNQEIHNLSDILMEVNKIENKLCIYNKDLSKTSTIAMVDKIIDDLIELKVKINNI